MTTISPENQKLLHDVVVDGSFKSEEEALAEAIRLLRGQSGEGVIDNSEIAEPADWIDEFRKWSRKSRGGNATMDDSRESIYEGRGQ